MTTYQVISILLAAVSLTGLFVLGIFTNILRESGSQSPFSFSKTQLWLWSMVIVPAFALHWGFDKSVPAIPSINNTSLILLGISGSATVAAAVVAKSQSAVAAGVSLKAHLAPNSFWTDILTDDSGNLSLVRLQQLLFTMVFIAVYISLFFKDGGMTYPDFTNKGTDNSAFVLMGVSAGTYVLGKSVNK